jgi:eukaryotic-like serine/threonine-protein kinase
MGCNYREIKKIGSGGFSNVFEIYNVIEGQTLAKKVLISSLIEDQKRFQREIRIMGSISHKNIMPILSSSIEREPYSYIMPLANGNLRDYIKINPEKDSMWIFNEILNGIKTAHDQNIIHRDLKPENILYIENGTQRPAIYITDFGLGLFLERDTTVITSTNIAMGTFMYCSPEQLHNSKDVDHLTDIYALGLIFYEILTRLPLPIANIEAVPPKYRHIIQKAIQPQKNKRYQSINELIMELDFIENVNCENPSQSVNIIVEKIRMSGRISIGDIKPLMDIFILSTKDKTLYQQILPNLPEPILNSMIVDCSTEFETILTNYDNYLDEFLEFDYCDVVARFYNFIFNVSNSDRIKSLIIIRLPKLGYFHNRYYVGEIFGEILSKLDDYSLITEVYNLLQENPGIANFCQQYFCNKDIPSIFYEFCFDDDGTY